MEQINDVVRDSILRDISDGVMSIGFNGIIGYVNPSCCRILGRDRESLEGRNFASCFFQYEENDGFNQAVIDAIYDKDSSHENFTKYFDGHTTRQLHMTTSFLKDGGDKIGIVVAFRDITEISELKNSLKAMKKIQSLNHTLKLRNKLLFDTFGRFLSDDIVREILDTPEGLELGGKKKEITILISDLRGFTVICEKMGASELITMLNHYYEKMTECIFKYQGTIIDFLGDGIFVIFGAPKDHPAHAADAVACALEMQQSMDEINTWNIDHGYPRIEMGIGINSGLAIVGNIGSMKRTGFGALGSTCNICSRIESYTTGGEIMISSHTKAAINTDITVEDRLLISPKGMDRGLTIYKISALGAPYNLKYKARLITPQPLDIPKKVDVHLLNGKHESSIAAEGTIISISETGAYLQTDLKLHDYDDLEIIDRDQAGAFTFSGKLFAKISGSRDECYILRFTSKPEVHKPGSSNNL